MCLSAALMAAAGAVGGSHGPVELSEPAPAQHHTGALVQVVGTQTGARLAEKVTSR